MAAMSPFDAPPSTQPVPFEPPRPPHSRRRTALVALASAGLVGGGLVAISQFASADQPSLVSGSTDTQPPTAAPPATVPSSNALPSDEGEPEQSPPAIDGEIVIDLGDGEPLTIDLGDLAAADLEAVNECLGFTAMELGELSDIGQIGRLPAFGEFGELGELPGMAPGNGHVTVAGPDGLTVAEFGEGDGSVTITQANGELTVTSDGDVEVSDLEAMIDELPPIEWGDVGQLFEGALPTPPDIDELQECLGGAPGS